MDLQSRPSPNHDERPQDAPVDMLVLHYTGMGSAEAALERLCDPTAKVSTHYLIDEDGDVHQLVAENRRAWHAGVSSWRGHTDINARSIGIELVNPGHEFGLKPYPEDQMMALEVLAIDILQRYPIPQRNVVGHSDVAPRRKTDPGELFDWQGLADLGIGLWPEEVVSRVLGEVETRTLLREFGYETEDVKKTVEAFQRRFRPSRIDGVMDAETGGLLKALSEMM